jgi:hypothetical protein
MKDWGEYHKRYNKPADVFYNIMTLTTYSTIDLPKTMAQSAGRSGWIR